MFSRRVVCGKEDAGFEDIGACLVDGGVKSFVLCPESDGGGGGYFELLRSSAHNLRYAASSSRKPAAIITPESKEELVSSVVCCRKGSWEIRVRCGGHSYEGTSFTAAAAGGNPFVIIDMAKLDGVSVDVDSGTAWVEGGATLGQTYHAISAASAAHAFSAGSCPTVGASGHIAGGGFGLLSRKYGLAADNVLDAVLITADGETLDRKAMGEETFWAIRGGGGGNWGIIYAWKIQLLPVPKTVTCFIVSRPGTKQSVSNLINQWQHVAPKQTDDFYLSAFIGAALPENNNSPGISATFKGFFLGPTTAALSILNQSFPELTIREQDCREMTWIDSILFFSGSGDNFTISDLTNRHSGVEKLYFKAKEWREEDDDRRKSEKLMEWIRGFYEEMTPYVSSSPRAAYVNYIDFDLGILENIMDDDDVVEKSRGWGEKYFLKNYDRLVRAKTMIDPFNVFRHEQSIPPLPAVVHENSAALLNHL
ncbi:PREDICTED: cannabidiolic acid synthase-like isoform X2 [Ipomoea nil]|uniref:cannabidiolic acid synthase-like isoform X2 n=1 Tax=Ipomoea nil TaxID=35883 RepID=UPI000900DE0B|nr:PREDICTED: cannabidiolic acid synthase-like isoform X2 [Ipomoea nil]